MTRFVETISDPTNSLCVGCGVDVTFPDVEHSWSCPQTTDVWPVTAREVGEDACCHLCGRPFALGEHYVGEFLAHLECAIRVAA